MSFPSYKQRYIDLARHIGQRRSAWRRQQMVIIVVIHGNR
jgi:hypothetical protein